MSLRKKIEFNGGKGWATSGMKTLTLLLLLCASSHGADITRTNVAGDLTTIVTEHMTKDGWSNGRSETVYRGKTKVFEEINGWTRLGKPLLKSRSYFVEGSLVMRERDVNNDGVLDLISIYHPGSTNLEILSRQPDGSVKPVSGEAFEASKKQAEAEDDKVSNMIRQQDAAVGKSNDSTPKSQIEATDADKEKVVRGLP